MYRVTNGIKNHWRSDATQQRFDLALQLAWVLLGHSDRISTRHATIIRVIKHFCIPPMVRICTISLCWRSLIVQDEFGEGIPVAWMISNRGLVEFFRALKTRVGSILPRWFTSDCLESNFWWQWHHVDRAWRHGLYVNTSKTRLRYTTS